MPEDHLQETERISKGEYAGIPQKKCQRLVENYDEKLHGDIQLKGCIIGH